MSITKLKTVGIWNLARRDRGLAQHAAKFRGRVITGMLTGGNAPAWPAIATPEGSAGGAAGCPQAWRVVDGIPDGSAGSAARCPQGLPPGPSPPSKQLPGPPGSA